MEVFNYDINNGNLIGSCLADESPVEPGVFIIPFGATDIRPPIIPAGKRAVFHKGSWVLLADSSPISPVAEVQEETQAQTIARYEAALDAHLDAAARAHRYDNRFTFALRAGFAGPYQAEGAAFAQWMDTCNQQAFQLLGLVLAGEVSMPASVEAFIATLPKFELP